LEAKKLIQYLKLYIGVHKLESTETQIIGIVMQKHPEMTQTGYFETVLIEKLPVGSPKLEVECIYLKSLQGFENPIKTDVLAICVSKSDAPQQLTKLCRDYYHLK
jgi:hypothetical protein